MRVLYWTQLYWPYVGGVEVLGSSFLQAMAERGHELAVVTSHGSLDLPDHERHQGVDIHRFPFIQALENRDLARLVRARQGVAALKREFCPDLVHVNLSDANVFFHWQTARSVPCPTLVSIRLGLPREGRDPESVLVRTLLQADWVTANSAAIRDDVLALAPQVAQRCSVIYNGLAWPPEPAAAAHPGRLVVLGRVVEDKGFDLALAALPQLLTSHPEAELVIGGDGPARESLEEQARALGVAERVRFAGWVKPEEVPAFLAQASVVLMPSRWREAFGLVALQAAQVGRPVVAAATGGLPEVVTDGVTGLLVPPEDPSALARAAAALLGDPERARAMGRAGRVQARERFSWDAHLDAFDRLYRHLARKEPVHALEA